MSGEDAAPIVFFFFFCAGGNNICKVARVELRRRFRQALARVRDLSARPVVCGILPSRYVSGEWLSLALAMNAFLADHCKDN